MTRNNYPDPEMNDLHSAKILLCYLMERIDRPISEERLYDIVTGSNVINHFLYAEALEELVKNGSLSFSDNESFPEEKNGAEDNKGRMIVLEQKGRLGAEYFNNTIPATFRRRILTAAFHSFAAERRREESSCEISPTENGFTVELSVHDKSLGLMKLSLYAPDRAQAELIAEHMQRNPSQLYSNVIGYVLDNPEESPDIRL